MALRVLMLGWEFPPVISGGLGVACQEIAFSLAKKCDLTLVIPFSSQVKKPKEFKLVGFDEQTEIIGCSRKTKEWIKSIVQVPTKIQEAYNTSSSFFEGKEKSKLDVNYINDSRQKTTQKLYSDKLFDQIQEYTQDVINYISPSDFDVVYAHDWMTFLGAMELQNKGLKFVAHVHSLTFDRVGEEDKGWIYQIERKALQKADRIIPVSHYTGRICCKYYQADFYKLAVVHNAISFFKTDFDKERNLKHIAFIGRLTYQKAPSHLIEIAKELISRDPDYEFTMIGEGDEYNSLKNKVKGLNLDKNIRLVGFVEHQKIKKVLKSCAIYCMPSISEPFGLSALEAVQYGLVPIISEQSGAAEVLNNAVKVNYWDKNGFVESIINISKNRRVFDRIHKKCVEDLELSSWNLTTEKILTILQET